MSTIITGPDLRAQRQAAGLGVQAVAELTGLPVAFIELLESGRRNSPQYIHRASKAIAARTQEGLHE